jgi:hypothetical protein
MRPLSRACQAVLTGDPEGHKLAFLFAHRHVLVDF